MSRNEINKRGYENGFDDEIINSTIKAYIEAGIFMEDNNKIMFV